MSRSFLFTSESVTEGHPDKMADQISDAILDAMISQDPNSRVACETMVTTGVVIVAGEITTKATVDVKRVIRDTVKRIGYDDAEKGFDYRHCAVMISLDEQSPDIAQGVNETDGLHDAQGAGEAHRDGAPGHHLGVFRVTNAAADHRVDVDPELGVLGQQLQFLVQHLQALLGDVGGVQVVNADLQVIQPGAVQLLDTIRRQQVAVGDQSRDDPVLANVPDDLVQLRMQ